MKSIHWLIPYNLSNKNEILNVNVASIRLRAGLFTDDLFNDYAITFGTDLKVVKDVDYLFIGKIGANNTHLYDAWGQIIASHDNVYIDFTDNHLDSASNMGDFYRKALSLNTKIIVSSHLLKEKINKTTKKEISVIEDPFEIEIQPIIKKNEMSFLWFGHETNRKFLYNLLEHWPSTKNFNLQLMTSQRGIEFFKNELPYLKRSANCKINLFIWSRENMVKLSKDVSKIIIPGDVNDDRKNGVSNNRLITSFALGVPVAATRYNSYSEFDEYFCNIDNVDEFKAFIEDGSIYFEKLINAQRDIQKYNRKSIIKKWNKLLKLGA